MEWRNEVLDWRCARNCWSSDHKTVPAIGQRICVKHNTLQSVLWRIGDHHCHSFKNFIGWAELEKNCENYGKGQFFLVNFCQNLQNDLLAMSFFWADLDKKVHRCFCQSLDWKIRAVAARFCLRQETFQPTALVAGRWQCSGKCWAWSKIQNSMTGGIWVVADFYTICPAAADQRGTQNKL